MNVEHARYSLERVEMGRLTLEEHGACIVRGLLTPAAATRIDSRFRANLRRVRRLFPWYWLDANKNVFSIAMAMADAGDATLALRMKKALDANHFQWDECITDSEIVRLHEEISEPLRRRGFDAWKLTTPEHIYARYERARWKSAYRSYFIHQDGALGLDPEGLTVWIALTPCGRWAPALQFIPEKRFGPLPKNYDGLNIPPRTFPRGAFLQPTYVPGDAVIFDAWTVHGTYIHPFMPRARTSLDVRLIPLSRS